MFYNKCINVLVIIVLGNLTLAPQTALSNEEFRKINKKFSLGFTGTCADGTALVVENGLIKSCA